MPGRGDNNQHGSAGRGARNQSNQPFVADGKSEPKSDSNKNIADVRTFNLSVDDVPYVVETEPFSFNDEVRYYVRVNGGTDHVFVWDPQLREFRSLDDDAAELPDALEGEISRLLANGRV